MSEVKLTKKSNIEQFIGNNIGILEDVLNKRAQKYLIAQKEKEKYDFGQKLTPEILVRLAKEVIPDVKTFLGITGKHPAYFSMFDLPSTIKRGVYVTAGVFTVATLAGLADGLTINDLRTAGLIALLIGTGTVLTIRQDYSGSVFDGTEKHIRIAEKKEVNTAGTIAHEYTHNLQDKITDLPKIGKNPIIEGHARGVEGAIANVFAQRYDNPAYAFDHTDQSAKELKDAYLFICRKEGIPPKESLANLPIPDVRGFSYKFLGHHYSIGVAAMSIAEAQHGDKVYRDVMKSDFLFLQAPDLKIL